MPTLSEMEWFIRLAERMLTTKNEHGREVNVVDALYAIANSLEKVAESADRLQCTVESLRKNIRDK